MTNNVITMTISEIEKSSNEFKKTHKIKVSGPYDDEDMPKWFKTWSQEVYEKKQPQWFKEWVETDYKPFKELVIDQFQKHGWIKK